MAPVQRGDWFFIRLPKYGPLAKSSLSLGFVQPMVFTDEQLQLIWWSSNSEDQWSKMLPLEVILFSTADIYYKALYSIAIFWICQKICFLLCNMLFVILPGRVRSLKYLLFALYRKKCCWPLCNLSLKLWKVKDERWEVCKESRNSLSLGWWQDQSRAGSKEGSVSEGDLVPQCLGFIEVVGPTLVPEWWLQRTYTCKQFLNWVFISCTYPTFPVL